ncbi:MAG: hypothetical protein GYA71_09430 [Bacteroidales bacterium]|jgi:predicted DNA-binding protein YlxM (UPF0122 family)|nr:hypothetical protein [Bacteroidales bacterium]OQB64575.1 MAG: hypothetical protein BWX96_00715 [Bacteroidetes bacterium ADurb.Bin145]
MKPDRSNYEIWLIDWLDGALDNSQTEQLMAFLEENPDIREEAESLSLSRLSVHQVHMPGKNEMKRSVKDLIESQIELLSVAYLENDLKAEQIEELNRNLQEEPRNRQIFETIQKIRLTPPELSFRNKKTLRKLTPGERILRISITAFSAATAMALLILCTFYLSEYVREQHAITAENNIKESPSPVADIIITPALHEPLSESHAAKKTTVNIAKQTMIAENIQTDALTIAEENKDAPLTTVTDTFPLLTGISTDNLKISVTSGIMYNSLAAFNNAYPAFTVNEDERSRLNRFLTRTFREKILNENISSDDPVKAFEIAQAGINGLNKLMGWEMALVETTGNEGEKRSVYFSSRLLKLNVPVRKEESGQ